jgi:hypothetical protein
MKHLLRIFVLSLSFCIIPGCQSSGENQPPDNGHEIEISVEQGAHWEGRMKVFLFSMKKYPQMAAWIEDSNGNYITTISVTEKGARKKWTAAPKEGRAVSLPVWNHRVPRDLPSEAIDTVSSATTSDFVSAGIDRDSLVAGNSYIVFLEINHSFDYNDQWTKENSGVNGQPSVIYNAPFVAGQSGHMPLVPIGQGSVDGSNGDIVRNLEYITTALTIIDTAAITVK